MENPAPITFTPFGGRKFWIFQTNPKRFRIFDWWDDLKRMDQWLINKRHRDKIRKMGIKAIWVSMKEEDDIWSIKMQYREKIANDKNLQAFLLSEKYDSWSVRQHKDEIFEGDMAALWVVGKDYNIAGIYGIAQIVTNPYQAPLPREGNISYWVKKKDREQLPERPWLRVSIWYITFSKHPRKPLISYAFIRNDKDLQDLRGKFFQKTNLGPIPLKQCRRIMELAGLT